MAVKPVVALMLLSRGPSSDVPIGGAGMANCIRCAVMGKARVGTGPENKVTSFREGGPRTNRSHREGRRCNISQHRVGAERTIQIYMV